MTITKQPPVPTTHPIEPDLLALPRDRRGEPERLVDRACRLYADVPELPHEELADLVEAFVTEEGPRPAEASAAVISLALSCVPDRAAFLDGDWFLVALEAVHVHYVGGGFGDRRTLALLERVLDWLHARRALSADEHARLLAKADLTRVALGFPRKRPAAFIEPSYRAVGDLTAAFVAEVPLAGPARTLARGALEVLESALQMDGGPLIFGRLSPALLPIVFDSECDLERFANRQTAAVWGCFYRWLADTGRMERARARALERALVPYTLVPRPFDA